jgi:hypothetical protein
MHATGRARPHDGEGSFVNGQTFAMHRRSRVAMMHAFAEGPWSLHDVGDKRRQRPNPVLFPLPSEKENILFRSAIMYAVYARPLVALKI